LLKNGYFRQAAFKNQALVLTNKEAFMVEISGVGRQDGLMHLTHWCEFFHRERFVIRRGMKGVDCLEPADFHNKKDI